MATYKDMRECTDPLLAPALKEALDVMEATFRLFPANCIWQSWNGAPMPLLKGMPTGCCRPATLARASRLQTRSNTPIMTASSPTPRPPGGKDAVVVMHLARVVMEHVNAQKLGTAGENDGISGRAPDRLRAIYFDLGEEEFPEVQAFVDETAARLDLELVRSSSKFREGIQQCIDEQPGQQLAFVLGTRDSDPNAGGQESFSPSSDWLPPFMRVNPIIRW